MAYARIKTWIAEILTAADLNAEFDGCIANENDLRTDLDAEVTTRGTLRTEFDAVETEHDTLTTAVQAISRGTLGAATEIDMATLYAADAEASDTYVITLSPVPAALYAGMQVSFMANTANTGAATINVNSLGAKAIVKMGDRALETGDIEADQVVTLMYDGTSFQMQSQLGKDPLVPRGHIDGLIMSNDTDTEHDVNVTAGEATDSTGAVVIKLTSEITKQIDNTWASGDDAGGMNDGETVGNTTWYHVFLIGDTAGGSGDIGFDTSVTAANLMADAAVVVAGQTLYRRIGSVLSDGSANNIGFSQFGDEFLWDNPPTDVSANDTTTAASRTLSIPLGVVTHVDVNVSVQHAGVPVHCYLSSLDVDDEAPHGSNAPLATVSSEVTGARAPSGPFRIRSNASSQIRSRSTGENATLTIATLGWIDSRGKDA